MRNDENVHALEWSSSKEYVVAGCRTGEFFFISFLFFLLFCLFSSSRSVLFFLFLFFSAVFVLVVFSLLASLFLCVQNLFCTCWFSFSTNGERERSHSEIRLEYTRCTLNTRAYNFFAFFVKKKNRSRFVRTRFRFTQTRTRS